MVAVGHCSLYGASLRFNLEWSRKCYVFSIRLTSISEIIKISFMFLWFPSVLCAGLMVLWGDSVRALTSSALGTQQPFLGGKGLCAQLQPGSVLFRGDRFVHVWPQSWSWDCFGAGLSILCGLLTRGLFHSDLWPLSFWILGHLGLVPRLSLP